MKLEMHCHSFGTSFCADCPYDVFIKRFLDAGYDGVVLTNHFGKKYFNKYPVQAKYKDWVEQYYAYYNQFKNLAKKSGLKVFQGAEIMLGDTADEFIILGFNKQFLLDNQVHQLSQKELFELCDKNGIFMYQVHPYRNPVKLGDPKYLHGAEAFNGHVGHENYNDLAEKFCNENNLIKMCGTDFHHQNQPITTAMIFNHDIKDEKALVKAIFAQEFRCSVDRKTYANYPRGRK